MSPERAPSLSPLRAGDDWSELAAAIFDHTPDFIWSADVEHFGLLTFNRAMRDWFRSAFGIELAVGKRPEDAFPPGPFVERWYEIYRTALREGRCETDYVSMVGSRTLRFELTLMRRPDGTPYAIAAFGRDLTDQRRAEDALRRREAFFRVLHEKSNDLAMVVGLDRSFKYVSESVLSYVGSTADDVRGKRMGDSFVHPDDRARAQDAFDSVVGSPGSTAQVRYRVRRADGAYRTFDGVIRNLIDDPDVGGMVVNARDVTDEARLEEALHAAQRLESVGRLAGGIAHDFNNAMTVVLSSAELARSAIGRGCAPDAEDLDAIIDAAERARDFTKQLLAFARKQPSSPRVLALGSLVESSRALLTRLLGEEYRLLVDVGSDAWHVRVDPSQITQVLLNLATNARDAMAPGGTLTISVAQVTFDRDRPGPFGAPFGDYVTLRVADTGAGMPAEVAMRAFEPFFTTKAEGAGSGLGLAIVHGVVAQSDGHVTLASTPGIGTTVTVTFPRAKAVSEPVARAVASSSPARGGRTILLVEDDDRVRRLAERILRGADYRVLSAPDGPTALALLERAVTQGEQVDLLLSDVVMPGMDGRKVAERAATILPGLPVLFMSGYSEERLSFGRELAPGIDLLPKPFTPVVLRERVRSALARAGLDPLGASGEEAQAG